MDKDKGFADSVALSINKVLLVLVLFYYYYYSHCEQFLQQHWVL